MKIEDIKALIKKHKFDHLTVEPGNNSKFEVSTIDSSLPKVLVDYINFHFNVVGKTNRLIVFTEK